jgi:hypothetical protein
MLRMLVLSDNLSNFGEPQLLAEGAIEIYPWTQSRKFPRPSDYEIVVLDMKVLRSDSYGLPWDTFSNLRIDISELFNAGGVVICLNYITIHTSHLISCQHSKSNLRQKDVFRPRDARYENNYDWLLYEDVLSKLNIADVNAKPGNNFLLVTKKKEYISFLSGVKEYQKVIDGIDEKTGSVGYTVNLSHENRLDAEVFALTKVTKKPIACLVRILNGSLILLPQSYANRKIIIDQLYAIGSLEYEASTEVPFKEIFPSWVTNYKHKKELELEKEIEQRNVEVQKLKKELRRFTMIDFLLCGTGNPLEDAVELALKDIGFAVEKTEKGASIDFKVHLGKLSFAIEVTGIEEKVFKDNKHFAHILHYLPQKECDEKILFLVNTYRNLDINARLLKEHFTPPVIEMSKNNHVVLMTTLDLFKIWSDFVDGKTINHYFEKMSSLDGEFKV